MKPVIITINSDGRVVMSAEEFKRHMDDAYSQGYSDGNSAKSLTYYNKKPWWDNITLYGSTTTESCSSDITTTTTNSVDDTQLSISDYLRTKGE